jgi:hypothetical protein
MTTLRSNLNIKGLPMRYNKLGDSGLLVSELSFGCEYLVHPAGPQCSRFVQENRVDRMNGWD